MTEIPKRFFRLLVLLSAWGCRRPPEPPEPPAASPELPPPPASSASLSKPLRGEATGFTNAMQAEYLRRQAEDMGIRDMSRRLDDPALPAPEPISEPLTPEETRQRREELRAMTRELSRLRRGVNAARDKSVLLPGDVARPIPKTATGGAPIEEPR